MDCRITRPVSGGTVKAIPSKSAAHRLMIAAGLSGLSLEGRADGLSQDISATKDCLEVLLGEAEIKEMNCRESGSTLRFMVPVAAALGGCSRFTAEGRLPERPIEPLKLQLEAHGCTMSPRGENPIRVEGKLQAGMYEIPGDVSSQYVTGLLMALPLCSGDSEIVIDGILQSRPYVNMTLDTLAKAGVAVHEELRAGAGDSERIQTVFRVPGNQKYCLPEKYIDNIEGDWSNGAFWLVMDAVSRIRAPKKSEGIEFAGIECLGLDGESAQGDKAICRWLSITDTDEAVDIDVADIPDLVPILSVLASARKKGAVTRIVNARRLRYKESDRLKAVSEVMNGLGADIDELEDALIIRGVETLAGGTADGYNDHRIVMMAAAAACISRGDVVIKGCEAVNKSYPKFFEDYVSLGGEVTCL
ncbi:MAG: 3-phosphoshikimate 1-carboxyvinyltransferase [Lentihominibacter sp.]